MQKAARLATDDKLLTIQEAADLIGVHYQTIRNWIKRGQIEYRQWGRTIRISSEAIGHGKKRRKRLNRERTMCQHKNGLSSR